MVNLHYVGALKATDELYALAADPDRHVYSYTTCIMLRGGDRECERLSVDVEGKGERIR